MLTFACISPHPPIILPTVGSETDREKVAKTISTLEGLAPKLTAAKLDIIIISSPHPDWGINVPAYFLLANLKFTIYNFIVIPDLIGDPEYCIDSRFRGNDRKVAIYPLLTTTDSLRQHFEWGKQIASQIPNKLRVGWIASGDLSHRLKEDGPYGLHPDGLKFDQALIKAIKNKNVQAILELDSKYPEAGECGLRSFCMLLGALEASKTNWTPEIISYEGPFGVGYLVVNFIIN